MHPRNAGPSDALVHEFTCNYSLSPSNRVQTSSAYRFRCHLTRTSAGAKEVTSEHDACSRRGSGRNRVGNLLAALLNWHLSYQA